MSNKRDHDTSYGLERALAKSIERVSENITKNHKLKREIIKLRQERKQVQNVPDDVKQWFKDTEGMEEEEGEQ